MENQNENANDQQSNGAALPEANKAQEVKETPAMDAVTEEQIKEITAEVEQKDVPVTPPPPRMANMVVEKNEGTMQTEEEEKEEEDVNAKLEKEIAKYPKPTKIPYVGYKVPMRRQEVAELFNLFVKLGKIPNTEQGGKWGYFVIRNAQRCRSIMKETDNLVGKIYPKKENPREKEYREKEFKLFEEFSMKDDKGNPIMEANNFKIKPELKPTFDIQMNNLRKEYDDVMKMYQDLRDKSREIQMQIAYIENPYMIYSNNLPAGMTPAEQEFIDPFVIEVE